MKHEVGKDGVKIAMFVVGSVKSIAVNAKKIIELEEVVGKLDEVAQESLDLISGSVDEVAGKSINKFLKENDVKGNFLNYEGPTCLT